MALSGCGLALPEIPLHLPRLNKVSERTQVQGDSLTLAAPAGYCVDPASRQDGPNGAFVLWGSCAAIAENPRAPQPQYRAMLSAAVGPVSQEPVEKSFRSYERFFRSEAGRAALARSGMARDVRILEVRRKEGLLLMKVSDRSAPSAAQMDAVYWREITSFAGHVAALSVLPLAGSDLDDQTQIALLEAFELSIRAAN